MDNDLPRKLAAVLYADVAGYSRLTGEDEDGTHRRLRDYLDLASRQIELHRGSVVHYAGDAVLAEFNTVSDALNSATSIQREVSAQNRDLPKNRRVEFRIGINLGEVIVDRNDIYGEGVNVAARLETLADPGGVCISESVRSAIGNKLPLEYEFMGEQSVKNIKDPVRAYQVRVASDPATADTAPDLPDLEPPDVPSIAVLPFTNMSGDSEQEYFSDGIAEDLITALSKVKGLMVVARNSSFIYKGKAVDIRQVGREQGVRHVLEGSVRKSGARVRVTAQLIDARTGHHLWGERYDRDLEDIFAVQDEITREVVIALDVHLSGGEQARIWSSGTRNFEAWECVRRGMDLLNSGVQSGPRQAQRLCERALELDPDYAMAWVTLGWAHHHRVDVGVGSQAADEENASELDSALTCGRKAIELDASCADAYSLLGVCHLSKGDYEQAVEMLREAVALSPNQAEILGLAALGEAKAGSADSAVHLVKKAMRLCPVYPGWFPWVLGLAHRLTGHNERAIAAFEAAIGREPDFLALHVSLASTLGELGRKQDAQKSVSEILRLDPNFSIKNYVTRLSYKDPGQITRFEEGLRGAGLPE